MYVYICIEDNLFANFVYFSQTKVKLSWLLFNSLYGMVAIFGARLCYEYQTVHTLYSISLLTLAIYNGASYYIDVFAERGLGVEAV